MKRLLCVLLLCLPALALPSEQQLVLKRLESYYTSLGMENEAQWLAQEVKAGRIDFQPLESGVDAECDIETGRIAIQSKVSVDTFRKLVDLGNTLIHERRHQNQDPEGWKNELWREKYYLGNRYEREGWAAGLLSARKATLALQDKLRQASPGRQREVAASRLQEAVASWKELTNDWVGHRKNFGDFASEELVDGGFPISLEEMAEERKTASKLVKDGRITAGALTRSYAGKYQGPISGGAQGKILLVVGANQEVTGHLTGTYAKGSFIGSMTGRVTLDGLVEGTVTGDLSTNMGEFRFKGTLSGSFSDSGARGHWTAGQGSTWPSGSWEARR